MSQTMPDKPIILIVDDESTNIKILKNSLHESYDIRTARSGDEALGLIGDGLKPDLILLDIVMPGKDGFEVCSELKKDENASDIPVIFVTAMDDSVNEEKGLESGAVDYIYKPISPLAVRARIKLHLELQQHREFQDRLLKQKTESLKKAREEAKMMRDIIKNWLD